MNAKETPRVKIVILLACFGVFVQTVLDVCTDLMAGRDEGGATVFSCKHGKIIEIPRVFSSRDARVGSV